MKLFVIFQNLERMNGNERIAYKVLPSDSLVSISVKFDVNISDLRTINNLYNDFIFPGDIIYIPTPNKEEEFRKYNVTRYFPDRKHKNRKGFLMYFSNTIKFSPIQTNKKGVQFELENLLHSEILENSSLPRDDTSTTHTLVLRVKKLEIDEKPYSTLFFSGVYTNLKEFHDLIQQNSPKNTPPITFPDVCKQYPLLFKPRFQPVPQKSIKSVSINIDDQSKILNINRIAFIQESLPFRLRNRNWYLKYRLSVDGSAMISIYQKLRRQCPAVLLIKTLLHMNEPEPASLTQQGQEEMISDSLGEHHKHGHNPRSISSLNSVHSVPMIPINTATPISETTLLANTDPDVNNPMHNSANSSLICNSSSTLNSTLPYIINSASMVNDIMTNINEMSHHDNYDLSHVAHSAQNVNDNSSSVPINNCVIYTADSHIIQSTPNVDPSTFAVDHTVDNINKSAPNVTNTEQGVAFGEHQGLNNEFRTRKRSNTCKTKNDYQIIGAYLSCGLQISQSFYGTGESFVFSFYPTFHAFKWSQSNTLFITSDLNDIMIGGPDPAIHIDRYVNRGCSMASRTFNSPQLTSEERFSIGDIEIYTL